MPIAVFITITIAITTSMQGIWKADKCCMCVVISGCYKGFNNSDKSKSITTVRGVKAALASIDGSEGSSVVSHTVLATILNGKRVKPQAVKANQKDNATKNAHPTKKIKAELDEEDKAIKKEQICFKFRDTGACKFGSKCQYSHTV